MKKNNLILLAVLWISSYCYAQNSAFPLLEPEADFISLTDNEEPMLLYEVNPNVLPNQSVFFQEVFSIASGDWNDPNTWNCSCVPDIENSVTIMSDHIVTLGEDKEIHTLHVQLDGELNSSETEVSLTLTGDLAVYGSLELEDGSVRLDGIVTQTLFGNCRVSKLYLAGSNSVTVDGNLFVKEELWVGTATLNTNDRIYLEASGTNVAEVGPLFDGTINGDMNISKNISISQNGWISLASPMSDATVQTIVDDFLTTGFPGADYPNYNFTSVSYYVEESDDPSSDFAGVNNATNPLEVGRGYYVYGTAGNYVFNVSGEINQGEIDIPVTYNDNEDFKTDGLNLIANPYPATVNWDSEIGWEKENLVGAIYVWDVSQKQFRTYINGIGVNGGTAFVKPTESIWILANDYNPVLRINESAKALHSQTTQTSSENMMVSISDGTWSDDLVITTTDGATLGFDPAYDALKFNGDNSVPNISMLSTDDINLAISTIPVIETSYDLQMIIDIPIAGDFTISFEGVADYISDRCIGFEDMMTGEVYDLKTVEEFTFSSEIVEDDTRFVFHIGALATAEKQDVACHSESTGRVEALGTGDGPWNYSWFDTEMNLLGETLGEASSFVISDLPAGDYTVEIDNNDYCATLALDVTIEEPTSPIVIEEFAYHIGCDETNTGELYLNIQGGVQPYDIVWDNEMDGNNIEDLAAGAYVYNILDAEGCARTGELVVNAPANVSVGFNTSEQVIMLDENGVAEVNFINTSVGTTEYEWDFGDDTSSSDEAPVHEYTEAGFYTVSMFAGNEQCDDYYQAVIVVEAHTGIKEFSMSESLVISNMDNDLRIELLNVPAKNVQVEVLDLLGKRLSVQNGVLGNGHNMFVNLAASDALYLISVLDINTGEKIVKKVSKI